MFGSGEIQVFTENFEESFVYGTINFVGFAVDV
jgi:hypothetical protein